MGAYEMPESIVSTFTYTTTIPFLQMKKLRHREVVTQALNHQAMLPLPGQGPPLRGAAEAPAPRDIFAVLITRLSSDVP